MARFIAADTNRLNKKRAYIGPFLLSGVGEN